MKLYTRDMGWQGGKAFLASDRQHAAQILNRIREAKHQDVLNGLLAEIMIDAENLLLMRMAHQAFIERLRRSQIASEGLLHDDSLPRGAGRIAV